MTTKDFMLDNSYRSRKFLLSITSILLIAALGILWAYLIWPQTILALLIDGIVTMVLGYCGITSVRAAIPMASELVAKTKIASNKPLPKPDATENMSGSKDEV